MNVRLALALLLAAAAALVVGLVWHGGGAPAAVPDPGAGEAAVDAGGPPSPAVPVERARPAPGPVVGGTVLGPGGAPEAGVRVDLLRVLSPWPDLQTDVVDTVLTADDGRFRFSIERGPDLRVVARKPGLAPTEIDVSPLDPGLVLSMRHGYAVEGFVEGPRGRRIADCEVILEPVAFSARRALRVFTDRDGRFRFSDVPAGAARLTARNPDFQPTTNPSVSVGTREVFRLTFSRYPLQLRGTVTTAGTRPEPIEGATVRLYPGGWNSRLFLPTEARTDAAGRFDLRGLGPGNMQLVVRHPRFSTRERQVSLRGSDAEVAVELVPRSRVAGRLAGGDLHPGIRLQVVQWGEPRRRTSVAADGSFAFDGKLSAGKAELTLLDDELCFEQTGSHSLQVDIEDGDQTELELEVARASVVGGVVRDSDGEPLPGVRVLWQNPAAGPLAPPTLVALTDAGGRYEARGLPRTVGVPGFSLATLAFVRHGYASKEVRFAPIAPGERLELDPVQLVRPGVVEGHVTRRGKNVAGAVVFVGNGMSAMQPEVSGPRGEFRLRDVSPGTYRLKAMYATLPLAVSDVVEVAAGETTGPVELELPAGRTVRGRVVAPDGSPVSNAVIVVRGMRGAAFYGDANGEFSLEVPYQEVELQVFGDIQLYEFRVHETVRVPVGQDRVTVTVPIVPSGTLVAKVLGLPHRKAVAGGIVRLRSLDPPSGDEVRDRQRDVRRWVPMNGGELRLETFPAGRSRFELHCDGYVPVVRDIEMTTGEIVDLGEVLLEPGARVRGIVTGDGGAPVAGARVHLGDELDRIPLSAPATYTGDGGEFEISGVGPRSRDLVVVAEGYAPAVVPLRIPGDLLRRDPLPVHLDRGATIAVTIQDDRAEQKELSTVFLNKHGKMLDLGRPDENGVVRFEHRSPGQYQIEVFGEPDARWNVDVEEAKTYELTIELGTGQHPRKS